MNKRLYLQECCNKYGDFKVAKSFLKADGTPVWSKHKSVLECWSSNEGLRFLDKVNNRTCFPCEIFLDVDTDISLKKLNEICSKLEEHNTRYRAYFSGSKGFHIHIYEPLLVLKPKYHREKIRDFIIDMFGCDLMKKTESSMLALENTPHWKTGKMKTLVRLHEWEL